MSTLTWSFELRTVVKNLKQFGLGNSESLSIISSNPSLPSNEQKAIIKEFVQKTVGNARKPITSPKEFWFV
jgi:hypothetical protein